MMKAAVCFLALSLATASEDVTIRIQRESETVSGIGTSGVLGKLSLDLGSFTDWYTCDTLELPYRMNAECQSWQSGTGECSSIPPGVYTARHHRSDQMGEVIWLDDAQTGRKGIYIHAGNYIRDTDGCILVGTSRDQYQPAVWNSQSAMADIIFWTQNAASITVEISGGPGGGGGGGACVDVPTGWYDADGPYYDCAWYSFGSNCRYGHAYRNMGKTANQACCACGGGSTGGGGSGGTWPAPTPAPAPVPECVAGDLEVQEKHKGLVKVSELATGDEVRGVEGDEARSERWCGVLLVERIGFGELRGNFTRTHWVVDPSLNHSVRAHGGLAWPSRLGERYQLSTECPAVGGGGTTTPSYFTPLSQEFCNMSNLSWADYTVLYAALLRIVRHTGTFWFSPSSYTNNRSNPLAPLGWHAQLPETCESMLACAKDGLQCDVFEKRAKTLATFSLKQESHRRLVAAAYPRIGDPSAGIALDVMAPPRLGMWVVLQLAAACGLPMILLTAAALRLWGCRQGAMAGSGKPGAGEEKQQSRQTEEGEKDPERQPADGMVG